MLVEGHRFYDATFLAALRGGGVDGSGKRNDPGTDPDRRPRKKEQETFVFLTLQAEVN